MIECPGVDLWGIPADATVITTNGTRKQDGNGVMGRGCAAEALARWPWMNQALGDSLGEFGNHASVLATFQPRGFGDWMIVSMPVKGNWNEVADITLIMRSARELAMLADRWGWERVVMPRPGCGNGKLEWEFVGPQIALELDDRFVVVSK